MNVLIIEDENHSAERLQRAIRALHPDYTIAGITKSIAQSIDFLEHTQPGLIFSDIRLQDGLSFDIFRRMKTDAPIIFTTAYDQYAIQAFKFNSIDYLLKPIDADELEAAIVKATRNQPPNLERLLQYIGQIAASTTGGAPGAVNAPQYPPHYRERFLVAHKDEYLTIDVGNVCFIHSSDNVTRLYLADGRSAAISSTLDQLEKEMDPAAFFRANRQYVIQVGHIRKVSNWFNYKLKVEMAGYEQEEILVSREKAAAFKKWLDK